MKPIHFVILAAGIFGSAMPADAQIAGTAPYEFINAVRVGDGNRATELLGSAGAGILDTRDGNGETALTIAIARSDEQFTGFLLGKGADPNRSGKGGDTPLIIAARIGFAQGMEWLLGVGAKVDATNKMGETALIAAVMQRQTQSVRRLLAAGADPDKADTSAGYTARDYAQRDPRARQILQMIEAKKPKK